MNELLVISKHNKLVTELSLSWSNNFVSTIIGTQKIPENLVPNFIILHNFDYFDRTSSVANLIFLHNFITIILLLWPDFFSTQLNIFA